MIATARTTGTRRARAAILALCGGVAMLSAGCDGGVQLNGKVFDAMGTSGNGSSTAEPKMAQRTGLVVPPSTGSLPVPGSQQPAEAPEIAGINDPDKIAKVSQAEKQRQQDEYCKVHYEQAKQRGDDNADLAEGPLGSCKGSLFTGLAKWQKGNAEEEE
jgi:hypothetical protein